MFKSRAVEKVNLSNSCFTGLILGIGNGFLTSHLFTSLKLLMKRTVLSILGIVKEGDAHSDVAETPTLPDHTAYSIL